MNVDYFILATGSSSTQVKSLSEVVDEKMSEQGIETAAAALSSAKNARIRISIPVSAVKMEYVCHKKPDKILELAKTLFAK